MTELPKIVRERLKAQASGPVDLHPDADLLTAFCERTLTEIERQQVIAHLALCADCRHAVALALPPQLADAEPARPQREQRRLGWAHWFALAASVVVVATAVLQQPLRQGQLGGDSDLAVSTTRPAPATSTQVTAEPKPAEGTALAELDKTAAAKSDAPESSRARSESAWQVASEDDFGEGKARARTPAEPGARAGRAGIGTASSGGAGAGSRAAAAPVVGGVTSSLERERRDAPSVPPPAPAARANEIGGLEESRRPADLLKSKDAEAAKQESAAGSRKPERQGALADSDSATGQKEAAAAMNQATVDEKFRAQVPATTSVQAEPQPMKKQPAGAPAKTTSTLGALARKLKAPLRWTVSAIGVVQRSFDGGKTWQDLTIHEGVRFRAVAAQDGSVWAGGNGGWLFHSSDGGQTWTPHSLTAPGYQSLVPGAPAPEPPAFDILRIDITPSGQVSVTTSQGQTFTSTDGTTWSQQ